MYTVMTSVAVATSGSELIAVALLRPEKSNPHSSEAIAGWWLSSRNLMASSWNPAAGVQELHSSLDSPGPARRRAQRGRTERVRDRAQPRQRESLSLT